jgi:hypothetical protein
VAWDYTPSTEQDYQAYNAFINGFLRVSVPLCEPGLAASEGTAVSPIILAFLCVLASLREAAFTALEVTAI